jgi:hypothetical protein
MSRAAPAPSVPAPEHEDLHDDVASADEATSALLALLDPAPAVVVPEKIHGVVVGTLLALEGGARVAWPGAPGGVAARALGVLDARHVGGEVALMFEGGDPARPMIMAPIESLEPAPTSEPLDDAADATEAPIESADGSIQVEAIADGERVVLEAERELVLRCGKASITLTRAGKIIIRGAYVSSHATGTHRIRGGTVEIN